MDSENTAVRTDVAIVGAGVSGLATAFRLKAAGVDCLVFEREQEVGGRTKVVKIDGSYAPAGAGVVYVGTETDQMLGELGVERRPIVPTYFGCHYDGLTIVAANDGQLIGGLPLSATAKSELVDVLARIRADYALYCVNGLSNASDSISKQSFADYLGPMHPELQTFLARIAHPSCMIPGDQISAKYAIRYLVSKMARDAEHIAFIPRGFQDLAFALHDRVSDEVRLETNVRRIESLGQGYRLDIETPHGPGEVHAKALVLAVPGPEVGKVMPSLPEWKTKAIAGVGSMTQVVMSVVLDDVPQAIWSGIYNTAVVGRRFDWISDCRAGTGLGAADGRTILQIGIVGERAVATLARGDEEITREWLDDLEYVFPGSRRAVVGSHVQRWEHCFAMPRWDRHIYLPDAQRPAGGVFFAGDYASASAGTHGCIDSAGRVAGEVSAYLRP